MLHIVNKSPSQTQALASCLRVAAADQAVLLIEDGVYAASRGLAGSSGLAAAVSRLQVYVLQPDVEARGMADRLIDGVQPIDYGGFVDLVARHTVNQSWL